jgi:hypothetical protein
VKKAEARSGEESEMSGRVDRMGARFERALDAGTGSRAKHAPNGVVARRYRAGMEECIEAVARVRGVLQELGVAPRFYFRYLPFGQTLARFSRTYSHLTLENVARGLLREWELRLSYHGAETDPPDGVVLRAICERAFGIRFRQGLEG